MPIAYRNSWRVVKVSMRNAVIGIMMPLVSMNPVVSHCTVLLGTSNSCINVGRAEIISVWLRMATNEPIIRVMTMAVVLAGVVLLELAGWWSRPQRWPARNCVTSIIKSRFLG